MLPRRSRTVDLAFQKIQELLVQGLSSLSILGDQLVKDLQTGKPTSVRQVLDQAMDSIALVANANYKLNMKRRELIKPDLNPTYTRLCKENIWPSTYQRRLQQSSCNHGQMGLRNNINRTSSSRLTFVVNDRLIPAIHL